MSKLFILIAVILGFTISLLSFEIGSSGPDYGPPDGGVACRGTWVDLQEVQYRAGFPFNISGTVMRDVACASPLDYIPRIEEILVSWQFYANAIFYTGLTLLFAYLLKKTRTKPKANRTSTKS